MEGLDKKKNRGEIEEYFKTNKIPTEDHFKDLIQGMANYKSDGMVKSSNTPLRIKTDGSEQQKGIEFYLNSDTGTPEDKKIPVWSLVLNDKDNKSGFGINKYDADSETKIKNCLFIEEDTGDVYTTGSVGIGVTKIGGNETPSEPSLHVKGNVYFYFGTHKGCGNKSLFRCFSYAKSIEACLFLCRSRSCLIISST
ncbi:MAG: hypothetical protein D3920_11425, partial [Candidatus Electrothrix sp. AW2]|nr:hypothetical protein [Candidatus Electrothrix gigas]